MLPQLDEAGHAEDVEVEADPGEGEDEAEAAQHEAVELHHPAEAGEAGAVQPHHEAGVRLPVNLRVEGAGPGAGLAVTLVTRSSAAPTLGQQAAGSRRSWRQMQDREQLRILCKRETKWTKL